MKVDEAILNRKTQKVLAKKPWKIINKQKATNKLIDELLSLAQYAPYYKKSHRYYTQSSRKLNSCVPWRFYALDTKNCRKFLKHLQKKKIKTGKIENMLAAAEVLFLVTWLPDPSKKGKKKKKKKNRKEPIPFTGDKDNMEHIASASAAIQNVLIGATARNLPNYWSSGGKLRDKILRNHLGIPMDEVLLGALFIFPEKSAKKGAIIRKGQFRNRGKDKKTWSKRIEVK